MIEPIDPQGFLNDLEQQLAIMTPEQQLVFGAVCCERHFPDYLNFSNMVKWGDPEALRRAINQRGPHRLAKHASMSPHSTSCLRSANKLRQTRKIFPSLR